MSDRSEHIACALISCQGKERETWCGRPIDNFVFVDVTHAALNGVQEGSLVLCEDCRDLIVKALSNGIEEKEGPAPFVQIMTEPDETRLALDEDGGIWRFSMKIGSPGVFGWYRVDMERFEE
jgi:hypothetical protein